MACQFHTKNITLQFLESRGEPFCLSTCHSSLFQLLPVVSVALPLASNGSGARANNNITAHDTPSPERQRARQALVPPLPRVQRPRRRCCLLRAPC